MIMLTSFRRCYTFAHPCTLKCNLCTYVCAWSACLPIIDCVHSRSHSLRLCHSLTLAPPRLSQSSILPRSHVITSPCGITPSPNDLCIPIQFHICPLACSVPSHSHFYYPPSYLLVTILYLSTVIRATLLCAWSAALPM